MKRPVIILGVIAIFLAASTIYLWHELTLERARHPVAATGTAGNDVGVSRADSAGAQAVPTAVGARGTETAPASHAPASGKMVALDARQGMARQAAAFLAKYSTTEGRAELAAEAGRELRMDGGLREYLGLDDASYDRFVEMLVQHDLASRETMYRCSLDERCNFPGIDQTTFAAQRRNAASMFGPDILDKYEFYSDSFPERRVVTELRGRLPDSARLDDATTARLVRVLYDENRGILADITKSGGSVGNYNHVIWAPMDSSGVREQNDATLAYNARLYDRAADILTPGQLQVYSDMRNEALEEIGRQEGMRRASSRTP